MANPFLGGLAMSAPVHSLLLLNGSVFGISGFLHRASRSPEAVASTAGLFLGGIVVGLVEGTGPSIERISLPFLLGSGLLVGIGTKLGNGCTSGHMLAGLSRLSPRSIVATATFFFTGVLTSHLLHANDLRGRAPEALSWTLDRTGSKLLALQAIPLLIASVLYISTPRQTQQDNAAPASASPQAQAVHPRLRLLASLTTGFEFALALRLSSLSEADKVIAFLLLPGLHEAFDPSLALLALGAIPTAMLLYRYARGSEVPRLGGSWSIPKNREIDAKLLVGAATFGVGWAASGFCPGPGIVNLGRAISTGSNVLPFAAWLAAVVVGGRLV
uniref:Sulphur transport domain-containing protein n=1 Tax=Mycena chlorophos TaxID=658473 RepID=A0ABQ0LQC0_MYCCL|nr:predicted protein [Mycena chlorophos]